MIYLHVRGTAAANSTSPLSLSFVVSGTIFIYACLLHTKVYVLQNELKFNFLNLLVYFILSLNVITAWVYLLLRATSEMGFMSLLVRVNKMEDSVEERVAHCLWCRATTSRLSRPGSILSKTKKEAPRNDRNTGNEQTNSSLKETWESWDWGKMKKKLNSGKLAIQRARGIPQCRPNG